MEGSNSDIRLPVSLIAFHLHTLLYCTDYIRHPKILAVFPEVCVFRAMAFFFKGGATHTPFEMRIEHEVSTKTEQILICWV